jgi:hypothetical protein
VLAPALVLLVALGTAACASLGPLDATTRSGPTLRFGVDTFAFPNESRSHNPGKPDLYANYCFVMARAVIQFQRFARFEPAAARVSSAEYERLVAAVIAHAPWDDPLPATARVAIPGYASLHELSREQEPAVKHGLGGRFWTLMHWTNWRVAVPIPAAHQEAVARDVVDELGAGRPVQLLVTNLPEWELNHTVVAYAYRVTDGGALEVEVYDPNDPVTPGTVTFEPAARRFVATRLHDTQPGAIRAFRMYYSPVL